MNQKIIDDINQERYAQDKEYGGPANDDFHTGYQWNSILTQRLGRFARSLTLGRTDLYRHRLVQIAAVAIAAIESLDRLSEKERPS